LQIVVLSRAVAGIGGGNLGVAQSYVADVTDPEDRDQAYAFQAAAFGAGFVVGPLLSGALVHFGYAVPFYAATFLELVILALTALWIPSLSHETDGAPPVPASAVMRAVNTAPMRNVLARQFLYIFGFTYLFTILGLYVQRVLREGASHTSVFLGIAGAVGAGAQLVLTHRLAKRFGIDAVAQIGFALGTIAYLALSFVDTVAAFIGFLVIWAASGGLTQPALAALISQTAPDHERGLVLGFSDGLNNLALMIAPAIGAAVIAANPRAAGVAPALALAIAFALGVRAKRAGFTPATARVAQEG
jgi:MFS family permease